MLDFFVGMRSFADLKNSGSSGGISDVSMSESVKACTLAQSVFDRFFEGFAFTIGDFLHTRQTSGRQQFWSLQVDPTELTTVFCRYRLDSNLP
jgi:hypothetical protein